MSKAAKRDSEVSKPALTVSNNSITIQAHSIIKNYIEHAEVRERYIAHDKEIGKEKIEVNKLRMEASHFKFLIEKEAATKIREEKERKEKDSNYYRDFTEKYKNFAVERHKEDKEYIRKIKDEAKEDLKQSKRARELVEENREIMRKVEQAQQKQNEYARVLNDIPKIVTDEECLTKTDEQFRKEYNELKRNIEVKQFEKTKTILKTEVSYLKNLITKS